jgi:hypothetical protein
MKKETDIAAALRAALAAYIRETYGIPITSYREAWFNGGDGDPRYPFEVLYIIDVYDSINTGN